MYMDAILIFSSGDKEEHLCHVSMVLTTLQHYSLFAKASKYAFSRSSVAFLGHVQASPWTSARLLWSPSGRRQPPALTCTTLSGWPTTTTSLSTGLQIWQHTLTALCSPLACFYWS